MRPRPSDREGLLHRITLNRGDVSDWDKYPWNLPIVQSFDSLELHPAVTFLVGENGSGKSTFIEALAIRMDFTEIGGMAQKGLRSRFDHRERDGGLHDDLQLTWNRRRHPADYFFMRAETVYEFADWLDKERLEDSRIYNRFGGRSLHTRSHGEAFLAIIQNRFRGESMILMDEPESALSPSRQLTFLKEIDWLVREGCQLIIATHSPIILSYPDAQIYQLTETGFEKTTYEETEHYQLTRNFLNRPESYLRHLVE